MRIYPNTIIGIIEKSGMNINQISKVSGISNTYLTKLAKNKVNHPGKDKIASILLALNYTITDINAILAEYDYMPLNEHDIPGIIENNRRRKFEGRIVPHFDHIYFELVIAGLESIGGTKIIVKHRPSGIYIPMDLYLMKEFPEEEDTQAAQFFKVFTHEVVTERKRLFLENCRRGYRFETYMCRDCLEESLDKNIGPEAQAENAEKVELFIRYLANATAMTLKFPDQHIHQVVKRCAYFHFQFQDAYGKSPKISFTAKRQHYYHKEWEQLNLESFLSDAPNILDIFYTEVDRSRSGIDTEGDRHTADGFAAYLKEQCRVRGVGDVFDRALAQLMAYPGPKLH